MHPLFPCSGIMMITLIITAVMTSVTLIISQSEKLCRMTSVACAFCGSFSAAMAEGARDRSRHNSGQSLRERLRSARRANRNRTDWYPSPPAYNQAPGGQGCGQEREMDDMNNQPPPAGQAGGEEQPSGCAGGSVVSQPSGCPGGAGHTGSVGSNLTGQDPANSLHNIGRVGSHKHIE